MRLLIQFIIYSLLCLRLAAFPVPLYAQSLASSGQAPSPPPIGTAYVMPMDGTLRLRASASLEAEVLAYLPPFTTLSILAQSANGRWLQVLADLPETPTEDALTGWVVAEFVELNGALALAHSALDVPFNAYPLVRNVSANARAIVQYGQTQGLRLNIFSKMGDSITAAPQNLAPIGNGQYTLGDYAYLQEVIDVFSASFAREHNAFANPSLAAGVGWTSLDALNPAKADPTLCQANESPVACELRLVRPSLALILFGTNDVALLPQEVYIANLRQIAELCIQSGTLPVLSTLPPRDDYDGVLARVAEFNDAIRQLALSLDIPYMDSYSALMSLPDYGLDLDRVHPNSATLGVRGAADFRAPNLRWGYVMRNLLQVHLLDVLWREVLRPASE